jgi:hypothetical protein
MIEPVPLRFFAGAPAASATTFLIFFTFSVSRSGTEAAAKLTHLADWKKNSQELSEVYIPLRFFASKSFAIA